MAARQSKIYCLELMGDAKEATSQKLRFFKEMVTEGMADMQQEFVLKKNFMTYKKDSIAEGAAFYGKYLDDKIHNEHNNR